MIKITETARDAMQGIKHFIPTEVKIKYINTLLRCGFTTVDCGSFVSPKVIPQMADSLQVIQQLEIPAKSPELMALVVNAKGTQTAIESGRVTCLSYPFSVSPTFLSRNLNTDEASALALVKNMIQITEGKNIDWVIYLSMGFGNPYGDAWSIQKVADSASKLFDLGIRRMPLSDILGEANPDVIYEVYDYLNSNIPEVDFGLHLHTKPSESFLKLEAAHAAGVTSYETVLNGFGGCPTAADEMVGNLSTQDLMRFFDTKNIPTGLNYRSIQEAAQQTIHFQ
jgi:hydroxymethylglutaryl-CoA lyase